MSTYERYANETLHPHIHTHTHLHMCLNNIYRDGKMWLNSLKPHQNFNKN